MHNTKDKTNYFRRHAEETLKQLSRTCGAILVTGPGQSGKTSLLKKAVSGASYITLDDPNALFSAAESSSTFFKENPPPVFIDKIQYAPSLLEQIDKLLGLDRQSGQFYLCSSRQLQVLDKDRPTSGKYLKTLVLAGLSLREKYNMSFSDPFLPNMQYFSSHIPDLIPVSRLNIWDFIHRGGMPGLDSDDVSSFKKFHTAYIRKFIDNDVREYIRLDDTVKFLHFMAAAAMRTGQPLNLSSMARECGISQTTAKRWISILQAYHIVYLLKPFPHCCAKRTVKSPKLYYMDTGLSSYLIGCNTPHELEISPASHVFFENFVLTEILKSYYNKGFTNPPMYFCRAKGMHEISLLIEKGSTVYPLVIKPTQAPCRKDLSAFSLLDKIPGIRRGSGGIICLYDWLVPLRDNSKIIPVSYL